MRWLCGKCFRKEGLTADDVALKDSDCEAFGRCEECGAIGDIFKIKEQCSKCGTDITNVSRVRTSDGSKLCWQCYKLKSP